LRAEEKINFPTADTIIVRKNMLSTPCSDFR